MAKYANSMSRRDYARQIIHCNYHNVFVVLYLLAVNLLKGFTVVLFKNS